MKTTSHVFGFLVMVVFAIVPVSHGVDAENIGKNIGRKGGDNDTYVDSCSTYMYDEQSRTLYALCDGPGLYATMLDLNECRSEDNIANDHGQLTCGNYKSPVKVHTSFTETCKWYFRKNQHTDNMEIWIQCEKTPWEAITFKQLQHCHGLWNDHGIVKCDEKPITVTLELHGKFDGSKYLYNSLREKVNGDALIGGDKWGLPVLTPEGIEFHQNLPVGEYRNHCSRIRISSAYGGILECSYDSPCPNHVARLPLAYTCNNIELDTSKGKLICQGPMGSFRYTCPKIEVNYENESLSAECKNDAGNEISAELESYAKFGHIVTNCHGTLKNQPGCEFELPKLHKSFLTKSDDGALLEEAFGEPFEGRLHWGAVYKTKKNTTESIIIYRVWNSAKGDPATGHEAQFGRWWLFKQPDGNVAQFREDYAICTEWSPLDKLSKCTLKKGAEIAVGTGQSVYCTGTGCQYQPSDHIQIYIGTPDESIDKESCETYDAEFSWVSEDGSRLP